jgi:hypothetical protein
MMSERNGHPREISEDDSPPSPAPSLDRLAYQVREERTERIKQHALLRQQLSGLSDQLGELSALIRHSEMARAEDMRTLRKAIGDLAEGQGRIAAELAAQAQKDSVHEEAITGIHQTVAATKADLAIARAKWLGWRSLAAVIGWGILEALKHWLGG